MGAELSQHSIHIDLQQWTEDQAEILQEGVDRIFQGSKGDLCHLEFSFTMSDPGIEDCPMIGCSSGFMKMTEYGIDEIVGRNCRFLVDPVPLELIDQNVRRIARDFCEASRVNQPYEVPDALREPWMPHTHSDAGVFCLQTNARKSGKLFKNLFHLKKIELNERPFLVGLQTELPEDLWEEDVAEEVRVAACREACLSICANLVEAERVLARTFWYTSPMSRQEFVCRNDEGWVQLKAEQ
mmetsp:Transcript_15425/g.29095  ORF Transcript_15425/g.29095 Transcript_15425/m.29095 type:complete len:240 (+) Transcript_15425:110-829(+)